MAIYHLTAKIIQRSKGKNIVAAAAYRRATKLFDEKEGRSWDYTNKPDVTHVEIIIPENAPAWVKELTDLHQADPSKATEKLWNLADASEKRTDSQLAREIEFALPMELTQEQNILLAREFIKDQFAMRGMIADWSVHWDEGNPHIHVLLTMRELKNEGFGKRVLEWNNRALLYEWRQKWAEYANFHLRLHQHNATIDHRSYQEQGIDLVPTIHQGKAVFDMAQRGIATQIMQEANDIKRENLIRIAADPKILLNKLSAQSGTFSGDQLGQALGRYINDQGKFSHQDKGLLESIALPISEYIENESCSNSTLTPNVIAEIIKSIEHHDSVFTERTIAKAVGTFTHHAEEFAKALVEIKASNELLHLGAGDDGRDRYTTRKMFALENDIQKFADIMRNRRHIKISAKEIKLSLERYQFRIGKRLTSEQITAVNHILKSSAISCLVGRAGTGKSFSLGAAKVIWEGRGLRVQGVTLSGVAADGLIKDADIQSRTIESFRYALEKGSLTLNHHDVIVMDEAGMTDSVSMMAVLKAVEDAKAKLVLVGDHAQIQPVGPGASFRALLERLGFAEIHTIYRQNESWQREATVAFSGGRIADGLNAYEDHGCIHFVSAEEDAKSQLANDWFNTRENNSKELSQYLVIAHRNEDVKHLNILLRVDRMRRGEITEGYTVNTIRGEIKLSHDDRVLFLKNDRRLGVSNGRFATIKSIDFTESGKVVRLTVVLDGNKKEIHINPHEYRDFTYGYAATVHKVQGMTVDHAFVYAGGVSWNRNLTYVALSRHRETCHLYADKGAHQNRQALYRCLGRFAMKDSLLDFPLAFSERRGIDTGGLLNLLSRHLSQRLKALKDKIVIRLDKRLNREENFQRRHRAAQEKLKFEKTQERRENAKLVAVYVDLNREVGIAWQGLKARLNAMGFVKMTYESSAHALILETQEHSRYQSALCARNKAAYQIMRDLSRYEKAIEIYEIDINKLNHQSKRHIYYDRVIVYADAIKCGEDAHRNQLAAEISQEIKAHYPYLKNTNLDVNALNHYAHAHNIQQNIKDLGQAEQAVLKNVEYDRSNAAVEKQVDSIESLLVQYIDMELEQTRLVNTIHMTRPKDPKASRTISENTRAHLRDIKEFASRAMQHPDIKILAEKYKNTRPVSLAQCGGFIAIRERICQGKLQKEDVHAIIVQLRGKTKELSRDQSQDRDLGGRTQ